MNLGQLRCSLREMLGDETGPYLWPDKTLDRYLNNAVREACIRARLLKDDADSQPAMCTIAVQAGVPIYTYSSEILVVRSGVLIGSSQPKLWALTADSMDRQEPYWDSNHTDGSCSPRYMVMDLTQKSFRLYPIPTVDAVLQLRVWRAPLPAETMVTPADEPIIHLPDPEELKHWCAHEAYLKNDSETNNPGRAAQHLAIFEQRFGSRPSLNDMSRWADSPPRVRLAHMF